EGTEEGGGGAEDDAGGELASGDPGRPAPGGGAVHARPGPPGISPGRRPAPPGRGGGGLCGEFLLNSPAGQDLVHRGEELAGGPFGDGGEEALAEAAEKAPDGGAAVGGQSG